MTAGDPGEWKLLFRHALAIIDAAGESGERLDNWSFGGGTVLARRYRHRVSRDIDIFVPDPQYLGYFSPRLNDRADALTSRYLETAISVKLYFAEGEIDFIASSPLTEEPTAVEVIERRSVNVESTAEILAKKIWHRGRDFTARDIFDFAHVVRREPRAITELRPLLRKRRRQIEERIRSSGTALRTAFDALARLDTSMDYDDCVEITLAALSGDA
jgi:predicted nucleotidyltransferase component of viral defense system